MSYINKNLSVTGRKVVYFQTLWSTNTLLKIFVNLPIIFKSKIQLQNMTKAKKMRLNTFTCLIFWYFTITTKHFDPKNANKC